MAKKSQPKQKEVLFKEKLVPAKAGSGELFEVSYDDASPVECLGMTFENDAARREHFTALLREKLKDPEFRAIEGFPIAEDEDILELSDPPYYTACPNPFLREFIEALPDVEHRKQTEPYAADVNEGKNDAVYNAHSYHTKVPHRAIMHYILHYTNPGEVVLDGFCGSGMTGVAAQLCGDANVVASLGYNLKATKTDDATQPVSIGKRRAIVSDLAPAATFIAANLNAGKEVAAALPLVRQALDAAKEKLRWLYQSRSEDDSPTTQIMYTVWSDVFICPNCSEEVVFWIPGTDNPKAPITSPTCAGCGAEAGKREADHAFETVIDSVTSRPVRRVKRQPVMVNVKDSSGERSDREISAFDLDVIRRSETEPFVHPFPTDELTKGERYYKDGLHLLELERVDQFFTNRTLRALGEFLHQCETRNVKRVGMFLVTSVLCKTASLMHNIGLKKGRINLAGALPNVLYVPSTIAERNIFELLGGKLDDYQRAFGAIRAEQNEACVTTGDAATLPSIPDDSVDYIFVDPPFGHNLMYSELNEIWEAWLGVKTAQLAEAVVSKAQEKGLMEYQELMKDCFREFFRVLKAGHWLTVEFHNSKNNVWNAIQESLSVAGFVVASVDILDKGQGTRNQMTQAGSVNKDLIISAYKPDVELETRFQTQAGSEQGAWEFVDHHLAHLPVFAQKGERSELITERQNYLLFDRMVAFHVQRGVTIPLSAAEFYAGLKEKYAERDGMFFLPDQAATYDKKRVACKGVEQLELFVSNETSAIQWLKQRLSDKPQAFRELQPEFMQEIATWESFEKPLELAELLEQNFICFDGLGEVPSQIHRYLSSNFKELRNLAKTDALLQAKAKDRWYVPDPRKEGDLEKIRNRALMKEFEEYRQSTKKLRVVRTEALRLGFKECWQKNDYISIISIAKRVKESIIQDDPSLLMYYDNAVMRTEG